MYNPKKKVSAILKKLKKQGGYSIKKKLNKKKFLEGSAKKMSENKTWPEREFEKMMNELEIPFECQKIVGGKIFDYYVPHKNMLIEVDGCYFHFNPDKFDTPNKMQKRNMKNDKFKNVLASGMGYELERVWESDLKEKYSEVKKRFKKLLSL